MTTVIDAIKSQVSDWRLQLAMAFGANIEGGNDGAGPWGVGDNGNSHGPFQINLPYHPGVSEAQANDPSFAVSYMAPSYAAALSKVAASLWSSDPEKAAEQTTFYAENPAADYYVARGQAQVDSAYQRARTDLANGAPSGPGGSMLPDYNIKPPLSATDRAAIIAYLTANASKINTPQMGRLYKVSDLATMPDGNLAGIYHIARSALSSPNDPISNITGAITGTGQVLGSALGGVFAWIPTLVLKAVFTIGGLGLAVLGLYAASRPAPGGAT